LSLDGTYKAMGQDKRDNINPQFTDHCFTGEYPTQLLDHEQGTTSKQYSLLTEKN
jgi:amidophosphoribosyltransferase